MSTPPDRSEPVTSALAHRAADPFRLLVESVTDCAIFMLDPVGNVASWNVGAERIKGYKSEEVIGRHFSIFYPGDDVAAGRPQRILQRALAEGRCEDEGQLLRKDGTPLWAMVTVTPLFDHFSNHIGFAEVTRDITDNRRHEQALRNQAEPTLRATWVGGVGIDVSDRRRVEDRLAESERKYRELVEHANSIILRWNSEGRITFINEFGQRFFGYTAEEIIGRHVIGTIVPPTESGGRDLTRLMEDILDAPEPFEQNVNENMRRNGERVWIAWTNRIVRDAQGRVVELLSIGTDITARRRAESALREAELRFHTLFEQTPVGVVVVDPATASIIECNEQAAQQLGYTSNELSALGLPDIEAIKPREDTQRRIAKILLEGRDQFETQHKTKSGEIREVLVSARLLELTGRTVMYCVFLDITERKQAEAKIRESEAHLIEAQRIAKIGSWEFDIPKNRLRWSDQIYEIFGIPKSISSTTPEAFFEAVHPSDRDRLRAAQQAALAGQARLDIEHRIVMRDGSEKVVHELADLKSDESGRPILLAGTIHDITDRVRIQAEREKRHRAETADRIKSAFLATMSHELRTPLNSIIGFTGIVLQGLAGPLNPEQTKQLGMVRSSARHLLELINDVLDISKIEAGQLEVRAEPFDLPTVLDRAIASMKPLAEKKGLALTANVPPELPEMVSDRRRVEQILLNLLNNAIKFTDQGGVTLTVEIVADFQPSPEAPRRPAVRLRVADTGIGIKPEDLALLFQPFRQLDTGLMRQHDGTGLGLAICRRLAGLLGGEISARSEWQHGSEFTVIIPLQKAT